MVDHSFLEHVFGVEPAAKGDQPEAAAAPLAASDISAPQAVSAALSVLPDVASAPIREVGDSDDDVIRGTADDDILLGLGGNDRLIGRAGEDTLNGASGNDRLQGGGGGDRLIGGAGNDSLFGGGGADNIKGGGGDDTIRGGGGADTIKGNGGSDTIRGNGGDDSIIGGGGADTIIAGPGNDTIKGGGGNDVFIFSASDINRSPETTIKAFQFGRDTVDLSAIDGLGPFSNLDLVDTARGAELTVNGNTILFLRRDADDFDADDFNLDNNDPFFGTPGDDALTSGPGSDLIQGFAGNDTLGAGVGEDTLIGGAGQDIFVVRVENGAIDPTVDIVRDFNYPEGDRIGLTEALNGIDFDALEDVVRVTPTGGDSIVAVDRGAGFQDVLRLEGVTFTTQELVSYGFTAPPVNNTAFVENPYGFQNRTQTSANPKITEDGTYVVWVDQQNLDDDPNDLDPFSNVSENSVTRDVFVMNTQTKAIQRVAPREEGDSFSETGSPAISEDGRFVAYVNSDGDVFVQNMALPDTAPVQVNITEDGEIGAGGKFAEPGLGAFLGQLKTHVGCSTVAQAIVDQTFNNAVAVRPRRVQQLQEPLALLHFEFCDHHAVDPRHWRKHVLGGGRLCAKRDSRHQRQRPSRLGKGGKDHFRHERRYLSVPVDAAKPRRPTLKPILVVGSTLVEDE